MKAYGEISELISDAHQDSILQGIDITLILSSDKVRTFNF